MKDRSTTIDLLLAFAAIFVITLTMWPRLTARQAVSVRDDNEQWTQYSLEVDDPRLAEIQQQLRHWAEFESQPKYISAKWQLELAEFYCSESVGSNEAAPESQVALAHLGDESSAEVGDDGAATITLSDTVATVGFQAGVEADGVEDAAMQQIESEPEDMLVADGSPSPSDKGYWESVRKSAGTTLDEMRSKAQDPPVVVGELLPPKSPQLAFHFAFLFGIAGACGHMHWVKRVPSRKGVSYSSQSVAVMARLGTTVGVLGLAFICAVAIWI